MEIINSSSVWWFWDLFRKTVKALQSCESEFGYEREIIRFLERLPNGDYSNIKKEWDEME